MRPPQTAPVLDADELEALLAAGTVTVLDVRYRMGGPSGRGEYLAGHLPGAAYVDLDTALAAPPGPTGRHPLPDPAVFEQAMRAAGVYAERPVVVYDDWAGRAAARCWWLLRWAGHADVRVLDGGWSAWTAAGRARSTEDVVPAPGDIVVRPGAVDVVPIEEVLDLAAYGVLVDAREPARFRGEIEPVDPVAGHIPGALNVPTSANLTEDGRFRTPEELRAAYPVAPGQRVAAYCGSGITATHDILAMAVAGIDAALYPGSWSEWVEDRIDLSRPMTERLLVDRSVGLLRASHPVPCAAVTALTALLAVGIGHGLWTGLLVTGAVGLGQLSIGWSNDLIDAARDREVGRSDKPLAAGELPEMLVRRAVVAALVGCVMVSLACGAASAVVHLLLGVGSGWAYNLVLKRTAWSALPYALAFGTLPAVVTLALPEPYLPPLWTFAAGALLGVGAHLLNALPDLADDVATGVRGLPHRLGAGPVRLLAPLMLLAGSVVALLGPGPPASALPWVALAICTALAVVAITARGRVPFVAAIAIALVDVVSLVLRT